jgi:hypothetical protein
MAHAAPSHSHSDASRDQGRLGHSPIEGDDISRPAAVAPLTSWRMGTVHGWAVRSDMPAGELAAYCLHCLTAVGPGTSGVAVRRLGVGQVQTTAGVPRRPHPQRDGWSRQGDHRGGH